MKKHYEEEEIYEKDFINKNIKDMDDLSQRLTALALHLSNINQFGSDEEKDIIVSHIKSLSVLLEKEKKDLDSVLICKVVCVFIDTMRLLTPHIVFKENILKVLNFLKSSTLKQY